MFLFTHWGSNTRHEVESNENSLKQIEFMDSGFIELILGTNDCLIIKLCLADNEHAHSTLLI